LSYSRAFTFGASLSTINTGNSGGPMFGMNGDVIGIVSHNISKSGGSEGLGFVVTINTAKKLLLEKRSVWGGLDGQILSDELADLLNLPPGTTGYLIKNVAKGSPADDAGMRGGTILATIAQRPRAQGEGHQAVPHPDARTESTSAT
jgi:serine protease Do